MAADIASCPATCGGWALRMCEKWHVRKAISVSLGVRWQKAKRITTIGVVGFCVFVYGPQYSYTSSSYHCRHIIVVIIIIIIM